jgi:hypothetical protein
VGTNALFGQMVTEMKRYTVGLFVVMFLSMTRPVAAQVDLSGNWVSRQHEDWQERGPGPDVADYLGLPINDEARTRALSYSATSLSLPERQCLYYPPQYVVIGPQGLRIWSDVDPNTGAIRAWNISAAIDRGIITIWMDGRPHPPEDAPHRFSGFTTGVWEGNTLTTYTTHVKEGYLRRNGVPTSDQTTFTLYISRHGDTLTITAIIEDPVYLTEPHILNRSWQLDPTAANLTNVPAPCVPANELPGLKDEQSVPHYLPGKNPFINDFPKIYNIPLDAVLGGAETMYPEYRKKLKDLYIAPAMCTRYCCGWGGGQGNPAPGLMCVTGGSANGLNNQ